MPHWLTIRKGSKLASVKHLNVSLGLGGLLLHLHDMWSLTTHPRGSKHADPVQAEAYTLPLAYDLQIEVISQASALTLPMPRPVRGTSIKHLIATIVSDMRVAIQSIGNPVKV